MKKIRRLTDTLKEHGGLAEALKLLGLFQNYGVFF